MLSVVLHSISRTLALNHSSLPLMVLLNNRKRYRVSVDNDGGSSLVLFHYVIVGPHMQLLVIVLVTFLASSNISPLIIQGVSYLK